MGIAELVILLDGNGVPIGTAPKATVHDADTPLHLGFSCYVLDADGRLLVTRRALGKRTWPGVWSNSFCGHPAPDEDVLEAVYRRGRQELGVDIDSAHVVLKEFRYRAVDAGGTVENEMCPVFVARMHGDPQPNDQEIAEWFWVEPEILFQAVTATPHVFSPWLCEELPQLLAANAFAGQE